MKRIPLMVANWKMHGSAKKVASWIEEISLEIQIARDIQIALCPPFVYLSQAEALIKQQGIPLQLGAQNIYFEKEGPFTGEISASMIHDLGCRFVILGHSERRHYFDEDDALIARKCQAAYDAGLIPILCVGETAEERNLGKTFEVVLNQLDNVLKGTSPEVLSRLVLAYEPRWAIGSGLTPTPEQGEEVHASLRTRLLEIDKTLAANTRILYGGSLKKENAASLLAKPNIDGGLVGGASLNAGEFLAICLAAIKAKHTES